MTVIPPPEPTDEQRRLIEAMGGPGEKQRPPGMPDLLHSTPDQRHNARRMLWARGQWPTVYFGVGETVLRARALAQWDDEQAGMEPLSSALAELDVLSRLVLDTRDDLVAHFVGRLDPEILAGVMVDLREGTARGQPQETLAKAAAARIARALALRG